MNVEMFRGKVQAGRIGIQPSWRTNDLSGTIAQPQFHIGHARSLLLASMICDQLDIPLWVRFKWGPEHVATQIRADDIPGSRFRIERILRTLTDAIFQMEECAAWLGVNVSRHYVPASGAEIPADWSERILVLADSVCPPAAGWTWDARGEWYDAAIASYPALMIRGADWCPPMWAPGTAAYVAIENAIFEAAEHEKHIVHLPVIMVGKTKMSTSYLNAVSWRVLMPMGRESARDFLLRGIDFDNLPGQSTQWSWEEFAKAVTHGDDHD